MPKYDEFYAIDGIKIADSTKIIAATADTTDDIFSKITCLNVSIISKLYTMETLQNVLKEQLSIIE